MTESTSNHNWTIPEVGGSKDVWGQILNDFFDDELDKEVSLKGPFSERPSAGSGVAKLYLATDRKIVYYNDGSSWEAVYGLGTEDNPVPNTSHFESIQAETISGNLVGRPEAIDNLEGNLYLEPEGTDPSTVLENDGDMVFIHE